MKEMTTEEFNHATTDITVKIARMVDDVENPTVVLAAYVPVVAQAILNVSYSKQADAFEVLDVFTDSVKHCIGRMHAFMEKIKAEGKQ